MTGKAVKHQIRISINDNISLSRVDQEDWYITIVQDLSDGDFCIAVPTRGTSPLVLHKGDRLKISYIQDLSRFEFETVVTGLRPDNITMYVLALPKECKKIQLREFVRIPAVLEVLCAEVPAPGKAPVFSKYNSLDISGGGIRLRLRKQYPKNTKLILKLTLPLKTGDVHLELMGRVVRSWPEEYGNCYKTAVQFTEIMRSQQDLIVRYVFMKMSEQRKLQ